MERCCHVNCTLFGDVVSLVATKASLQVFDESGILLIEHPWPTPGTKYMSAVAGPKVLVGHAHPENCHLCPEVELSPMS